MLRLKLRLAAATAAVALSTPAMAQMDHSKMNMPGMTMPMPAKKPAAKEPITNKSAAKKSAAKSSTAKAGVARKAVSPQAGVKAKPKPTSRARPTPTGDPHAGHDMSGTSGKEMPAAHDMSTMPKQPASPASDPHAGHDMSAMPGMTAPQSSAAAQGKTADPHAGHDMSSKPGMTMPQGPATGQGSTADPHAGHDMGSMPGMAMPGHNMSTMASAAASGTNLPAGNAPPPPVPSANAADAFYGEGAMNMGRHHLYQFHGGQKLAQVLVNVLETQFRNGRNGFEWEAQGWYGGDINRLWIKSKGDGAFGRSLEKAEVQALYSRAIGPYFNLQGGLRYDFKPNPSRAYATIGVEGLAPSFFDVEGALFLSNKGELMARAEGSYDQRITQRLILQPRAEVNFAAQNSRTIGVGAGLSEAELGLRLRYDIRREFAPYVGVQYRQAFGRTRDYLRSEGEDASSWSLLTGVRLWF